MKRPHPHKPADEPVKADDPVIPYASAPVPEPNVAPETPEEAMIVPASDRPPDLPPGWHWDNSSARFKRNPVE